MSDEKNNENGELLLPDIEAYLENNSYGYPVWIDSGLDKFVSAIEARTALSRDNGKIVLRLIFEEIRNAILRGEIVVFRGLGSFFVSSPKTSGNKHRVFIRFRPSPILNRRLNER